MLACALLLVVRVRDEVALAFGAEGCTWIRWILSAIGSVTSKVIATAVHTLGLALAMEATIAV